MNSNNIFDFGTNGSHTQHDQHAYMPAHRSGAPAEESPYLKRLFWSGYKGYTRGVLGGVTLFTVLGVAIGAGVFGAAALFGAPIPALVIPSFGLFGAAYGDKLFGQNGRESGQIATALEIMQERDTIKDLIKGKSPEEIQQILKNYIDPYNKEEVPEQWFHGRVGIVGALVGGLLGCLAGMVGGAIDGGTIASAAEVATEGAKAITQIGSVAVGTVGGALGGASFGIDRSFFRKWFTVTNNLYDHNKAEDIRVNKVRSSMEELSLETAQEAAPLKAVPEIIIDETPDYRKAAAANTKPSNKISAENIKRELTTLHSREIAL